MMTKHTNQKLCVLSMGSFSATGISCLWPADNSTLVVS